MVLLRRHGAVCLALPVIVALVIVGLAADRGRVFGAPPATSGAPARKTAADRAAGRARPFEADRLLRAFRGKREDVRLKALEDIERSHLVEPALPDALWQVIEPAIKTKPVPDSQIFALKLYGQVDDPQMDKRLVALLAAADLRFVLSALDRLAERRPAEALAPIAALNEHPAYPQSYALRHAVMSAVASFNEPASVEYLVSTVAAADGQLKYLAASQLIRLTGKNFGGKGDEWRKWWQSQREGFRVKPDAAPQPTAPIAWDYAVPQFYGTPVYARRVVFVIDRSKSMLSSVGGVTRLDDAARQLEGAVRALPEDAWFEILAYNDTDLPFAGRLVQATPQAKSDAVRFMYSLSADGKTDSYDALADSLRVDANVEAILFLSDGDPNVGTIVDRPTIVDMITQQNKSLRAAISTVGIDARGAAADFLKQLAADNFGTYDSIR